MKIYIAGPLTDADPAKQAQNVARAVIAGVHVMQKGHSPYIPHLSKYINHAAETIGVHFKYEDWMRVCFEFLPSCEAILRLAPSPGVDRELAEVRRLGLKIYWTVEDVPEA